MLESQLAAVIWFCILAFVIVLIASFIGWTTVLSYWTYAVVAVVSFWIGKAS